MVFQFNCKIIDWNIIRRQIRGQTFSLEDETGFKTDKLEFTRNLICDKEENSANGGQNRVCLPDSENIKNFFTKKILYLSLRSAKLECLPNPCGDAGWPWQTSDDHYFRCLEYDEPIMSCVNGLEEKDNKLSCRPLLDMKQVINVPSMRCRRGYYWSNFTNMCVMSFRG